MRWSTTSVLILALGVSGIGWVRPDADAAVVCQRKNKIKLRAEACKESETQLFDTGEVGVERERVNAHDARLDEHESRLDADDGRLDTDEQRLADAEAALDRPCADPTRRPLGFTLFTSSIARCRMLDADPAACGQAFQLGIFGLVESCAHLAGKCIGCDLEIEANGLCDNTCQAFSCVDATRTDAGFCARASSEDECNHSWGLTTTFPTPELVVQGASCFWDEDENDCLTCEPAAISQGLCQNSCLASDQFPRCRAQGRAYGDCNTLNGNEAACNATYQFTGRGTATCWYAAGVCAPCEPANEGEGKCTNDC